MFTPKFNRRVIILHVCFNNFIFRLYFNVRQYPFKYIIIINFLKID